MKYILEIIPSQVYSCGKDAIDNLLAIEKYRVIRFGIPNKGEFYIQDSPPRIVERTMNGWDRHCPRLVVIGNSEEWWE